jgi:gamma-glutamylcyclotransferase (GGCT)/AIG2-like uncharacterized protein YtfP
MRNTNTPDPLPHFVYVTLLTDQPAHYLIAASIVQSAAASVAGLALYSVGRYPIAVPGAGQVIGEVHWLQPTNYTALLQELEAYEGPEYTRTRWLAQLADERQLAVWVFTGEPAAAQHLPVITTGDWRAWLQQRRNVCWI